MKHRIIAVALCLTMFISIGFTGCSDQNKVFEAVNDTVALTPLNASDGDLLRGNPDRGYRTELVIWVRKTQGDNKREKRTVYVDESEEDIRRDIQSVFDIYFKDFEPTRLALSYIYITDWRKEPLTEDLLRFFDIYFTMCREQKIKNMLRISYCDNHNELDRGADEQTIIRHVKQLSDTISKHADTIHTIECGFVGSYGEWAETYQYPAVDYATVIKTITENLAVPNNLYFSIRSPSYKNLVGKDYEHYWSISHNNDAVFGEQKRGWESAGYEVGTPEWEQVTKEGAYTPQGGEMFVNTAMIDTGRIPVGFEVILECYNHRHTSLSFWHGYLEAYNSDNVMNRWKSEPLTATKLDNKGIIYDPNWFLDDKGNTVNGNPFDFLRDHLGYRIVAEQASVNWSGNSSDKIAVSMTFKNYGFAAAFNMISGFAILDSENNVVSEIAAGEPKTWYNRDPDEPSSPHVLTHTVSAELDGIKKKGTYKVAFYLRNTMGTYARISNKLDIENGYNVLYTFQVG